VPFICEGPGFFETGLPSEFIDQVHREYKLEFGHGERCIWIHSELLSIVAGEVTAGIARNSSNDKSEAGQSTAEKASNKTSKPTLGRGRPRKRKGLAKADENDLLNKWEGFRGTYAQFAVANDMSERKVRTAITRARDRRRK
jgi:hypothetical protein